MNNRVIRATTTIALMLGAFCASPAFADGGAEIATAPAIPYGVPQTGTLADAPLRECEFDGTQVASKFWMAPVTMGDEVTFDWEVQNGRAILRVLPVGTTDFTRDKTVAFGFDDTFKLKEAGGKSQLVVRATNNGHLPVQFCQNHWSNNAGPYGFTANVLHAVSPNLRVLRTRGNRTHFGLTVSKPDGTSLDGANFTANVRAFSRGRWRNMGTTPAEDFTITWFKSARHRKTRLRVTVTAPGYMAATSRTVTFRVH